MKNIAEWYQYTGERVDDGGVVQGYYAFYPDVIGSNGVMGVHAIMVDMVTSETREVHADSVERVAVRVTDIYEDDMFFGMLNATCPNCHCETSNLSKSKQFTTCDNDDCGMRLDWGDRVKKIMISNGLRGN